ncbi:MAG: hypothetical protein KGK08_11525 [Acidobacteriota bacterium]|nr:hypothetical protein [Acidobacteriota bacterium]
MSDPRPTPPANASPTPDLDQLRHLAHELSNALEIIVQTSYLLETTSLPEPASAWLQMLNSGVQKAITTNNKLRKCIRGMSKEQRPEQRQG